jgi:DNA-binding CsgD family transcriptional regulator
LILGAVFFCKITKEGLGTKGAEGSLAAKLPGNSGVPVVCLMSVIYFITMRTAQYIVYDQTWVSAVLWGGGGVAAIGLIVILLLVINRSALYGYFLFIVLSVIGMGLVLIGSPVAVNAGSIAYGLGDGLGYIVMGYVLGGAVKRSRSYGMYRLSCFTAFFEFFVIAAIFHYAYAAWEGPNKALAFAAAVVLLCVCFMLTPLLLKRVFDTDWSDGYRMADMPEHAADLAEAERIDAEKKLGLSVREKEVYAMVLKNTPPRQIGEILGISLGTATSYHKSVLRKVSEQQSVASKLQAIQAHVTEHLTGQELRVAELILRGASFRGVAQALNITLNTAKSYGKSLYSKLDIHSMRELFVLAEQGTHAVPGDRSAPEKM